MRPARLAGILAALLLVACASAPTAPGPDVSDLARYTAERNAAKTFHRVTIKDAGREVTEGTITAAQFEAILNAGRRLESAVRNASAELVVYQVDGVETPAFVAAFDEMRAARNNLRLSWEAAHGP